MIYQNKVFCLLIITIITTETRKTSRNPYNIPLLEVQIGDCATEVNPQEYVKNYIIISKMC